ncbi:MAG: O-antigen polymerase [Eubacteriales bacterium]
MTIIIICFLISFFGVVKEKNIFNPLAVFYTIWGVALLGARMKLFGMNGVSNHTYNIISLGLVMFFLSYVIIDVFMMKNIKLVMHTKKQTTNILKFKINYKYLYLFLALSFLFFGSSAIKAIQLLLQGNSFHMIRLLSNDELLAGSPIIRTLRAYLFVPGLSILIVISAIDLVVGGKNKYLFISTFIVSLLQTLSTGGRITFLNFAFYIILSQTIFKKKINISKKTKNKIRISTLIVIAIFIFISRSRGISSLASSLYFYLSGAIPHLDYRIQIIDYTSHFSYGYASLNGLFTSFYFILKNIGIMDYPDLFQETLIYMDVENFVSIGQNVDFNAFVTPFFYFYLDARLLGVILGSISYGIIASLSYNTMRRSFTMRNVMIYMIIIQGLATSIIRFQFVDMAYFLSLVYILFLYRKRRIRFKLTK